MMVEEQGDILEEIEHNAEDTTKDLEQGVKHVNKAVVIARSTRAVRAYYALFFERIALIQVEYRKNGVASLYF